MSEVIVRNAFSPVDIKSSAIDCSKVPSVTKQSMAADCDINRIMGQYAKGFAVDHFAKWDGQYGDVEPVTYHEALNVVRKAEEMFNDLDSRIRDECHNDPARFLAAIQDPVKGLDKLREWGLAKPAPARAEAAPGAAAAAIAAGGSGGSAPSSSSSPAASGSGTVAT